MVALISWFDRHLNRLVYGHEFFCTFIDRDLSKCDAYARVVKKNAFVNLPEGWGPDRCPAHMTSAGPKIKPVRADTK